MSKNTPADADKTKPFLSRLRAAAEQLHALATAKTDAFRQAQLANIDWDLVADEFESVVGRYECSIERYAGQIIRNLCNRSICYQDCVDLQLALADLEAHLEDFEPGHDFGQDIAEAWEGNYDARDHWHGLVRHLDPIKTLEQLRQATAEKLDMHRRLDQGSPAYRSGWSVPHSEKALAEVLLAATLATGARITVLMACCESTWQPSEQVLKRAASRAQLSICDAVLAEIAGVIDAAVEGGYIEIRGDAASWQGSEIRLPASAQTISERNAQVAPPAGYATWLDFAAETIDTRSLEIERLLDDGLGVPTPTREAMRQAVKAELTALRHPGGQR